MARHLAFIDRLLADKDKLSAKCVQLGKDIKVPCHLCLPGKRGGGYDSENVHANSIALQPMTSYPCKSCPSSQACPECLTQCARQKVGTVSHCVVQAGESRHAAAVELLKEGWVGELKRQKEAWAAAEKTRRDTWLADKTKQVKELTVKVRTTPAKCLCACA